MALPEEVNLLFLIFPPPGLSDAFGGFFYLKSGLGLKQHSAVADVTATALWMKAYNKRAERAAIRNSGNRDHVFPGRKFCKS